MSPISTTYTVSQFGNALEGESDRVKLPFDHVWFWWSNGSPESDPDKGARYFGGWASDAEKFIPAMSALNQDEPPIGAKGPQTWRNREGNEFEVFAARAVYAAPIATRYYFDEKGGHIAILAYLATRVKKGDKSELVPYGPAVLTANGYAASKVRDAFKKWQSNTAKARAAFAPGVPANLFYYCIGTFGDKREQEMVGKPGRQSPIVPARVQEIAWDEAALNAYFVGDTVAAIMLSLKTLAEEWLKDIPTSKKPAQVSPNASEAELNAALSNADDFPF